jgi:hypothetical protein
MGLGQRPAVTAGAAGRQGPAGPAGPATAVTVTQTGCRDSDTDSHPSSPSRPQRRRWPGAAESSGSLSRWSNWQCGLRVSWSPIRLASLSSSHSDGPISCLPTLPVGLRTAASAAMVCLHLADRDRHGDSDSDGGTNFSEVAAARPLNRHSVPGPVAQPGPGPRQPASESRSLTARVPFTVTGKCARATLKLHRAPASESESPHWH